MVKDLDGLLVLICKEIKNFQERIVENGSVTLLASVG